MPYRRRHVGCYVMFVFPCTCSCYFWHSPDLRALAFVALPLKYRPRLPSLIWRPSSRLALMVCRRASLQLGNVEGQGPRQQAESRARARAFGNLADLGHKKVDLGWFCFSGILCSPLEPCRQEMLVLIDAVRFFASCHDS